MGHRHLFNNPPVVETDNDQGWNYAEQLYMPNGITSQHLNLLIKFCIYLNGIQFIFQYQLSKSSWDHNLFGCLVYCLTRPLFSFLPLSAYIFLASCWWIRNKINIHGFFWTLLESVDLAVCFMTRFLFMITVLKWSIGMSWTPEYSLARIPWVFVLIIVCRVADYDVNTRNWFLQN